MNDMFLFVKSCNFYNYANDNFESRSSAVVNVILSNLKSDSQISLKWFGDNGMKSYPSKFEFMIMSSENIEPQILPISDDVYRDNHWLPTNFQWTLGMQLNTLSRISKYLDTKS